MSYVPLEDCLDKAKGSVYKLTLMVAKRAQQLAEGAQPLIEDEREDKPIKIALREISQGYIQAK